MKNLLPLMLLVFVVLGCNGRRSDTTTAATPDPNSNCKLTPPECSYLGGALGYLKHLHEEDQKVAITMASAGEGAATLGDVKRSLEHAQTIEHAGFFGDYSRHTPPSGYSDIDARIKRVHQMHDDVFGEFLDNWSTLTPARIGRINGDYKATLEYTSKTIRELTDKMSGRAKELNVDDKTTKKKRK